MLFVRRFAVFALVLTGLLALSGLRSGVQGVSARSSLEGGAAVALGCPNGCSAASPLSMATAASRAGTTAAAPVPSQTCCLFNPFFSFRRFSPFFPFFSPFRSFSPFVRPFNSFFPFFRSFFSSGVNCVQFMRMPGGQTVTVRVC